MNEPGMPATPPAVPPSYLRPPAAQAAGPAAGLTFGTGVLAIVMIALGGWYFYYHNGSNPISGSIAFYSPDPSPAIYQYSLADGTTSMLSSPPSNSAVQDASFSPSGSELIQATADRTTHIALLTAIALVNGTPKSITSANGEADARFYSSAISDDGAQAAYLWSFPPSATEVKKASGAKTAPPPRLSLVLPTRSEKGTYDPRYFLGNDSTPLAFSLDSKKLLVRARNTVAVMAVVNAITTTIAGIPDLGTANDFHASLSPKDGTTLAFTFADAVHFGVLDWEHSTFTEQGTIPGKAEVLSFNKNGDLMVATGNDVVFYRPENNAARQIGSVQMSISAQSHILAWLTP